ncbi:flagellar protein FlaG [Neobacillus sp. YX16]|uniref:flagellar protein FlaG n=1 Tax=Neobacillus sp. YX16 TaxID=3047874 RepID=UPI0024C45463|nr:flagellar protein FlaG [Neobacillus sp. YX16]WHZ05399.1 flagellar protein FlaG [Neobacillus sp. YX16]
MLDKITIANNLSANSQLKPVEKVESVPQAKAVTPEKQEQRQQHGQSREKTEKVIASINDFLKASNSHLKFEFHDDLQEYYVTLVDDKTNEVIREIPSKKLLDMYAEMTEYVGLLVDKKI